MSIRTALANSVEFRGIIPGCTSRISFDNVTLTLHNVTLTSQKPYEHNNKCDQSKIRVINEVYERDILLKNSRLHLLIKLFE